jgi:hypothetical protein
MCFRIPKVMTGPQGARKAQRSLKCKSKARPYTIVVPARNMLLMKCVPQHPTVPARRIALNIARQSTTMINDVTVINDSKMARSRAHSGFAETRRGRTRPLGCQGCCQVEIRDFSCAQFRICSPRLTVTNLRRRKCNQTAVNFGDRHYPPRGAVGAAIGLTLTSWR